VRDQGNSLSQLLIDLFSIDGTGIKAYPPTGMDRAGRAAVGAARFENINVAATAQSMKGLG